jgi:hypothetical protein
MEKDSEPGSLQVHTKAVALMKETEGRGVPAGESEGLADGVVISSGGCIWAGSLEGDVGAGDFCERFWKYSIWPVVQPIVSKYERSGGVQRGDEEDRWEIITCRVFDWKFDGMSDPGVGGSVEKM